MVRLIVLFAAVASAYAAAPCQWAIVGAGPGGVYFAWRMAEARPSLGPAICIFEQAQRVGGRVNTLRGVGTKNDLVVEAGAYRFVKYPTSLHNGSIKIWTPLNAALVEQALELPTAPYEPGDPAQAMWKIVDSTGHNAGFLTYVEAMMQRAMAKGVRVFFGHEVISVTASGNSADSGGIALVFSNGFSPLVASNVLLNLPQQPLLRLVEASPSLWPRSTDTGTSALEVLYNPVPNHDVKLYVHYDDAWWRNVLNLTTGEFGSVGDPLGEAPPLYGRYHDGDVRCDPTCRGFLEASYAPDFYGHPHNVVYYSVYQRHTDQAYTTYDRSTPTGRMLLNRIHDHLVEYHADLLIRAGAIDKVRSQKPTELVLAVWDSKVRHFGAATHVAQDGAIPRLAVNRLALSPFERQQTVYVANEAFSSANGDWDLQGWSEGALVMAENLAYQQGLERPDWINASVYEHHVLFGARALGRVKQMIASTLV